MPERAEMSEVAKQQQYNPVSAKRQWSGKRHFYEFLRRNLEPHLK
jgi:hypothetical protein